MDRAAYGEMVSRAINTLAKATADGNREMVDTCREVLGEMIGHNATDQMVTVFASQRWECRKCGTIRTKYFFSNLELGLCIRCADKS